MRKGVVIILLVGRLISAVGEIIPIVYTRTWFINRRGGTLLLLALVIRPLTTHPFQDGAPFLLLTETPSTLWGLSTCLPYTR